DDVGRMRRPQEMRDAAAGRKRGSDGQSGSDTIHGKASPLAFFVSGMLGRELASGHGAATKSSHLANGIKLHAVVISQCQIRPPRPSSQGACTALCCRPSYGGTS